MHQSRKIGRELKLQNLTAPDVRMARSYELDFLFSQNPVALMVKTIKLN